LAPVPPSLTAARVSRDLDVVARAGLDLDTFLDEAVTSVGRAVPSVAVCLATSDPGTHLLTGAYKYGHLRQVNSHDHEFGILEYSTTEETAFTELARAPVPAAGVHHLTGGDVEQSRRMRQFMIPHFGFGDEARVMFREGTQLWGAMALFRGPTDAPFAPEELEFLASLSATLARGVRTGILTRLAGVGDHVDPAGPAVLIIGADDQILQVTPGAEARLADLAAGGAASDPMSPVSALVGAARRYRAGATTAQPRCRVRTRSGQWLVLHAAPLSAAGERVGEVVVTIEEARPPEIVDLVVAAFGLTARERDITRLVLQGADTKEIASALHLSSYTVQDHLKAVFAKADVRSRRELIARVYFEQYVPRMGRELSPSGWFAPQSSK
jgi:DNA-binding CsgD family transcriptional regulator